MNDGFKQRLVGAVVLVSLLLILWPVVFSDGINPQLDTRTQIPPTPSFEKRIVPEPTRPANIPAIVKPIAGPADKSPIVDDVTKSAKDAAQAPVDVDDSPSLDKQRLPIAWVLQVASFEKASNANELKERLLKQGHKAFTQSIETKNGSSTRVLVGPRPEEKRF